MHENYLNNSLEHSTYMTEKGKVPLVGVKPNASHLPDEHPKNAALTSYAIAIYVPPRNMSLMCHIYKLAHIQIGGKYINIYMAHII